MYILAFEQRCRRRSNQYQKQDQDQDQDLNQNQVEIIRIKGPMGPEIVVRGTWDSHQVG